MVVIMLYERRRTSDEGKKVFVVATLREYPSNCLAKVSMNMEKYSMRNRQAKILLFKNVSFPTRRKVYIPTGVVNW